jgi:lambda family phage portal protein
MAKAKKKSRTKGAKAPELQRRAYDGARSSRLTPEPSIGTSSADTELALGLAPLRNRCRALVRNNAYAKRARRLVESNVVGSGIGLQGAVAFRNGRLRTAVNDDIEALWRAWSQADQCHVAGRLHFDDLERLLIGEVFEAGEVFVRIHRRTFGASRVPLALEVVEAERIADDWQIPAVEPDHVVRLGIEQDAWGRPAAYWINSLYPGEIRYDWNAGAHLERVAAEDMFHLHLIDRWPQSRGEPWLHAVIRKLQDVVGYSQAEILAARAAAMYVGFIKSEEAPYQADPDNPQEIEVAPGEIRHLKPGESFDAWTPNRPNSQADPFIRLMLREIAAGAGASYESLSRDYSQSNYSSSRLSLLDDRDHWRMLQQWFIRAFREPLHRMWLTASATFGALSAEHLALLRADEERYLAVRFKPRGWGWVDPTKEVAAYKEAELAGYVTKTDVIAATAGGQDIEDVLKTRRRELDLLDELGLSTDTTTAAEAPEPGPGGGESAADSNAGPNAGSAEDTADQSNVRKFACR